MSKIIIICGPTASGKTSYAHEFAKNNNGEIVNADSMQLYAQMPVITASPEAYLKNEIPYHLYNILDVTDECSLAIYANMAAKTIKAITSRGKLAIVVGGTGLYIKALVNGFSEIPEIDPKIRTKSRELYSSLPAEEFFKKLQKLDERASRILHPKDSMRVVRAYEVYMQTGKSIFDYQENNVKLLDDFEFEVTLLLPERKLLYERCDKRLEQLFENGAIEEVRALYSIYKNLKTSAMKALGVKEIIGYLEGKTTKSEALELAQMQTRRYAKRQITWFRNQIKEKKIIIS